MDKLFGRTNGPEAEAFVMKVEDIFGIPGRGTMVTGRAESGALSSGDTVYFTTAQGREHACRAEVELDHETYPGAKTAAAGMNLGLMLRGVEKEEVHPGLLIRGKR